MSEPHAEETPHGDGGQAPAEHEQTERTRKPGTRVRIGVGLALVAVAALLWWLHARKIEDTDDAQVDGYITAVSSRVPGTVLRVLVEDNQPVKQGDVLVELDAADLEVAAAQARAAVAQAQAAFAAEQPSVSITATSNRATVQSTEDEVANTEADLEAARRDLDQAQLNLGYAKVVAPVAGIVGKRSVNVGDRVQPGQQLMSLTQNGELWVTANFRETQIERMRQGQHASVHVDAIDRDYEGIVESFAGATGSRYSLLPPENASGNYVKVVQRIPVRIKLEQGQPEMERLRPGMSAEPKVRVR